MACAQNTACSMVLLLGMFFYLRHHNPLWGTNHPRLSCQFFALLMPEAIRGVIINHARRLHVGVDNGRADKIEPALLQVFADGV
jgi:hypothetical protein